MKKTKLILLRRFLVTFSSGVSFYLIGSAIAWLPSAVLISSDDSPDVDFQERDLHLMTSVFFLGEAVSSVPAGIAMEFLGRRESLLVAYVVAVTAWTLVFLLPGLPSLYLARFLFGLWSGAIMTIFPVYLAEITEPQSRGSVVTSMKLMYNAGVTLEFVMGGFLTYTYLAYATAGLMVLFFTTFWTLPASPYWLIRKGQTDKAAKSLAWLKGETNVEAVLESIKEIETSVTKTKGLNLKGFLHKGILKVFSIVAIFSILQRLTGASVVIYDLLSVLPDEGEFTVNGIMIMMGCLMITGSCVCVGLVDFVNRRCLLLWSSVVAGMSIISAGLWYLVLRVSTDLPPTWVPVLSFSAYFLSHSLGLDPMENLLIGELLPLAVRDFSSGLISSMSSIVSLTLSMTYLLISAWIGEYLNCWCYGLACAAESLFIYYFIADSKGKTLDQIFKDYTRPKEINTPNPAPP